MSELALALVIDAALVGYCGYRDYREFSVPDEAIVASMLSLALVWFSAGQPVPMLALSVAYVLVFVLLNRAGVVGTGDIVVYARLPVVAAIPLFGDWLHIIAVFAITFAASTIVYYVLAVSPMLCEPRLFGVLLVKREHYMRDNVVPPSISVDVDEATLRAEKERILRERQEACLEARVGYPLIALFSVAYAASVAALLLGLYV